MLVGSLLISTINGQIHWPMVFHTNNIEAATMIIDDYMNRFFPNNKPDLTIVITDVHGNTVYRTPFREIGPRLYYN